MMAVVMPSWMEHVVLSGQAVPVLVGPQLVGKELVLPASPNKLHDGVTLCNENAPETTTIEDYQFVYVWLALLGLITSCQ